METVAGRMGAGGPEPPELIDRKALQDLLERFHGLVGLGVAITGADGKVLVAVGWQDICTRFHRVHPETCRNCVESDATLAGDARIGEYLLYKCKNSMWDAATPVVVGGRHIANVFFGQFFFDDETPDLEVFEAQARRYGFDRTEYLAALARVPRIPRERVRRLLDFYVHLARLAGELGAGRLAARAAAQAEQERRVAEIFDRAAVGIFQSAPEGALRYVNPAMARLFGYATTAEMLASVASAVDLYVEPGSRARLQELVRGSDEPVTADAEFRRKGGETFLGEVRVRGVRDHRGELAGLEGLLEDVSERRRHDQVERARARLLELAPDETLEELLRATLDEAEAITGSRIGFYHFLEADQQTLSLQSWSTRTMAEYCRAGGKGRHYAVAAAGVWVDCIHARRPVIHNDYDSLPHRRGLPPGHAAVLRELAVPVMRRNVIVAVLGVGNKPRAYTEHDAETVSRLADLAWDLVERKRAEQALVSSERALREAQRLARLGSWELDLQRNELSWSAEIYRIFEIDPQRFGASYQAFLDAIHPEDREAVDQAYTDSVKRRVPYEIVHRLLLPGGRVKYVRERCETFYDASGKPLRSTGTVQDITEQRRLEDQVRQSQKLDAIGRLAGGVAHDFNNLLTAILGASDILASRIPESDPLAEEAADIREAARKAAALTRQLLTFSRKQVAEPRIIDLDATVRSVERMLRRLIGENIRLTTRRGPTAATAKADRGLIEQVILNLVVNARDAMADGGELTLVTGVEALDAGGAAPLGLAPGTYVALAVGDTGTGMPAEVRAHLFEPFFTTKGIGKGTGLGLSTAYGIVKQAGGAISVRSEVGSGSTFTVYLPHVAASPAEPARVATAARSGTETILLAEDDPAVRRLALRALEAAGYQVQVAADGVEALRLARSEAGRGVHLLVTDVVMPNLGGVELARALRAERPGIAVLLMSGYSEHGAEIAEGEDLLQKPFTAEELTRRVRERLDREGAPPVR